LVPVACGQEALIFPSASLGNHRLPFFYAQDRCSQEVSRPYQELACTVSGRACEVSLIGLFALESHLIL
jgi:hypothetical protein